MAGTLVVLIALIGYCLLAARANTRFALGSDLGLWLLWPATGARPYRDFTDCKPPGIYAVAFLCHRLGGRTVAGARCVFEALCLGVVVVVALSRGPLAACFLAVFVFSIHFEAADAWLERASTTCFVATVVLADHHPVLAGIAAFTTIVTNLKLALSVLVYLTTAGQTGALGSLAVIGCTVCLALLASRVGRALLAELVSVPLAVLRRRYRIGVRSFGSLWNGRAALLGGPMVALSFLDAGASPLTLAATTYLLVNSVGRVFWPYHWIPLGVLCVGQIGPWSACFLLADALGARVFLGDVQSQLWGSRATSALAARELGQWLRGVTGSLWVAHEATQLYVYAGKAPDADGVAQYEIDQLRQTDPGDPEWVVVGPGSTWCRRGYRWVHTVAPFSVLHREESCVAGELESRAPVSVPT